MNNPLVMSDNKLKCMNATESLSSQGLVCDTVVLPPSSQWRWRPVKCWYPTTTPHVTTQKDLDMYFHCCESLKYHNREPYI